MRVSVKLVAVLVWMASYAALGVPPVHAAEISGPCAQAVALVEAGSLADARDVADAVGGTCATTVADLADRAESAAQRLAERAAAAPSDDEKERLATLSLALDDANQDAQAVLAALEPAQDADRCRAADQAVEDGELARAEALYDSLEDDEAATACRTAGLIQLAQEREARWPTRIQHLVLDDGLTTWVLALVAFAIGVVAAGYLRLTAPFGLGLLFTGVVAAALVAWQRSEGRWEPYAVLLLLSAVAGFWLSSAARTRAPVRVGVTGDDKDEFAPEVLAALHALGESGAAGVFAAANTDVADSGVTAALDQVGNPVVKAVLAVWRAVQLGAGDRVEVAVVAPEEAPSSATVLLYQGRRLVATRSVNGARFCADPAVPSDAELAASVHDVATGVAAAILLGRLRAEPRLYGAREPLGVALAAVAARRLGGGDAAAAATLYARAVDHDPDNRAARFGRISTALRTYPGGHSAERLITELEELGDQEKKATTESPLTWRIDYTRAAAIVNAALAGKTPDRRLLGRPEVVDAFRRARELLDTSLPSDFEHAGGLVVESDRDLWQRLHDLARVASLGLQPATRRPWEELLRNRLTAPSAEVHNVACGLAFAYAWTGRHNRTLRVRLAEACVDRLRLAGQIPARRAALLGDPCLGFVAATQPFVALKKEWGVVRDDPYADVDAFGALSGELAESYPRPRDLAMALATHGGRTTAAQVYGVDGPTVRRWAGAGTWLAAGQPASRINLYQASGYPDAGSAAAAADAVLQQHLEATAKVAGDPDLPSPEERAAMARTG